VFNDVNLIAKVITDGKYFEGCTSGVDCGLMDCDAAKMEAIYSFESLQTSYKPIRRINPEYHNRPFAPQLEPQISNTAAMQFKVLS
jgi:hypothetical protein